LSDGEHLLRAEAGAAARSIREPAGEARTNHTERRRCAGE
jgi:hypothetical protein